MPLWLEGMATYASGQLNPGNSDGVLLLDDKLDSVCVKNYKHYAAIFQKNSSVRLSDQKFGRIHGIWFAGKRKKNIKTDIPIRAGYCLGLQAVKHLAGTNTLADMAGWPLQKAHEQVVNTLRKISNPPTFAILDEK